MFSEEELEKDLKGEMVKARGLFYIFRGIIPSQAISYE